MKILFITPYYLPYRGGIERVIEKLSEQFSSTRRVEVGVLTTKYEFPRKYKKLKNYEIIGGVGVFRLNSFPVKPPPFYQVPLVWFSPLQIKNIIGEFKPDVIHLMGDKWFWGNFFALIFRGRAKVIFSLIFHDLALKQFLRPINLLISFLSDVVHVVTKEESNKVTRAYLINPKKIEIIPWGVGINKSQVKSHKSKVVNILCVGRLSKHKGQKWLLARYANAYPYFKRKTKLIFVGLDEGEGKYIKTMVRDLKLSDFVEFAGEVSEVKLMKYYDNASIFALFPEYETFGLVFLEAMGRGIPVLTHNVGTMEEILKDKAIIVNPFDEKQAEGELIELVNNKSLRAKLSYLSYQYVKENYSWSKTAKEFIELYQKA